MEKLKTVNIKGKEYVPVNERLKSFREDYPEYGLTSELVKVDSESALIKASITNEEGRVLADGTAFELFGAGMVNKTSHVENAETSAWGRALGNFGIGIDASVATADEIANVVAKPEPKKSTAQQDLKIKELCEKLEKNYDECRKHYTGGEIWLYETAQKAIIDLESAVKGLNKDLDSIS